MTTRIAARWFPIAALAAALFGLTNFFQPTVVVGESMAPTLKSGKLIWIDRTWYRTHTPQPGEVVVFRHDGVTYVKRIYRGPGATFHYVANGNDWLGPVRESRVAETRRLYDQVRSVMRVKTIRVPDDSVFVLGDNYTHSIDSREIGPIPISEILGRAHMQVDAVRAAQSEVSPRQVRGRHAGRQYAEASRI